MAFIFSIFLITHVYAIAYMIRKLELRVYRLSVMLLLMFALACTAFALFGSSGDVRSVGTFANYFVHAVWLQSLVCIGVAVTSALRSEDWGYLAHCVGYVTIFLAIWLLKSIAL